MLCSVCGSSNFKCLYQLVNGEIIQCIECRIVCRRNIISGEHALKIYDDDKYLNSQFFEVLKVMAKTNVEPYCVYNKALKRINGKVKKSRLLDIGCSYGAFMEIARHQGWNVFGVEISKKASSYAIKERHLDVFNGSVEQAKYPDNYFSVVTLWDVIEHLDFPIDTLREINRILDPKGIIVIFTINQKSLINFIGHFLYRLSFRKLTSPLNLLYDEHHNYFFSQSTLRYLLTQAGISGKIEIDWMDANIERWQTVRIPPILAFGSKCLDLVARVFGQRYRKLVFISKYL